MAGPPRTPSIGSAVPFGALPTGHGDGSRAASATFDYRNPAAPFRVEATLGEWHILPAEGGGASLAVSIAHGTLHDEDKGPVDLAGLELRLQGSDDAPGAVGNPGGLSELQQAGIVEAVVSHIQALGLRFTAATLIAADDNGTALVGVFVTRTDGRDTVATFWASRADWDAAGGQALVPTPAAPRTQARLTTFPEGTAYIFELDTVRLEEAVCVRGRLVHPHVP